ncbi:MAG: V-type ATP synthase subunit F [Euryarchaeota archaeon]|nr:V-type ATP synthase subunit F [Euryarchaeota archaeon]
MSAKVAVIGDQDTIVGFRLAGIKETYEVGSAEEAAKNLKSLFQRKDINIIVITERIAEQLRKMIDDFEAKKEEVVPIIVEIPDKKGPMRREVTPLQKLVKRAIGIEIILGERGREE